MTRDDFNKLWRLDEVTGCHEWIGKKYPSGYGYVGARRTEGFNEKRAHRIAYALANGAIPPKMYVLHRCDNPACVNAEHLFIGTQFDNMADMLSKGRGRHPSGERHGMTSFVEADVERIREAHLFGATQVALGRAYGACQTTIGRIVRREAWT